MLFFFIKLLHLNLTIFNLGKYFWDIAPWDLSTYRASVRSPIKGISCQVWVEQRWRNDMALYRLALASSEWMNGAGNCQSFQVNFKIHVLWLSYVVVFKHQWAFQQMCPKFKHLRKEKKSPPSRSVSSPAPRVVFLSAQHEHLVSTGKVHTRRISLVSHQSQPSLHPQ